MENEGLFRSRNLRTLFRGNKGYSGDGEINNAWRTEMRRGAHALRDARNHLNDLHQKALAGNWGAEEVRAATARAAQLLREAERLQRRATELQPSGQFTRELQQTPEECQECPMQNYQPGDAYEPPLVHELRMLPPSMLLAPAPLARAPSCGPGSLRSKSEMELSRRLSESLDMQERLAADNADLDVKRYILYKELMVKEQRLETTRAQAARLQAELKLLARDNAKLQSLEEPKPDTAPSCEPRDAYADLEKQLSELEAEVKVIQEMATSRHSPPLCHGKTCPSSGGPNICFEQQPGMPPMPPTALYCGRCPPCPATCNVDAPLTPAEKEVIELKELVKKLDEECKNKIGECAILRQEVLQRKQQAEKERCITRETKDRLRKLEMRIEGLAPQTNMQGPVEKAFQTEVNVVQLRHMLRTATTEIEDQRVLIAEMDKQLQDYRVKYLQAQQLAEEQTRQLENLDLDNVRISEQINMEIQKVKIKFQEKLHELAPLPRLLDATQRKLQDAQQQQSLAEHHTEQLARELICARDKITVLNYKLKRPLEKNPSSSKQGDEKLITGLQQKVVQLTDQNTAYKGEVDRLKTSLNRLEDALNNYGDRFKEKVDENANLVKELETVKVATERAIERANDRTVCIRKCMQTSIAELERQLVAAKATIAASDKERVELRLNMQNQISRLQDNYEVAQCRVRNIDAEVALLHRVVPETDKAPNNPDPCVCKGFLEEK